MDAGIAAEEKAALGPISNRIGCLYQSIRAEQQQLISAWVTRPDATCRMHPTKEDRVCLLRRTENLRDSLGAWALKARSHEQEIAKLQGPVGDSIPDPASPCERQPALLTRACRQRYASRVLELQCRLECLEEKAARRSTLAHQLLAEMRPQPPSAIDAVLNREMDVYRETLRSAKLHGTLYDEMQRYAAQAFEGGWGQRIAVEKWD